MKKHSTLWVGVLLVVFAFATGILVIAIPGFAMISWQMEHNRKEARDGVSIRPSTKRRG